MKKKLLVLLVPLALAVPGAAEAATAAAKPPTVDNPILIGQTPCFPNTSFAFTVDVFEVANNQKVTTTTTANGDVVRTTGKLVLRFTNQNDPSKSIVKNVSGPTTETTHTDGSALFEGTGNNWLGFGPNGQINTGEPGLVFTSGKVAVTFTVSTAIPPVRTAKTFSLKGHQENGCALLS